MTTVFSPVTKENTFATALFERLPNRYDALAEVLSFAQNARWRSLLVDRVCIEDPRQILDVATGTGAVAIALAQRMPAQIVGVDISDSMLNRGRRRVADLRLESQVRLQMGRAEALPFETASFDAVILLFPGAQQQGVVFHLRPSSGNHRRDPASCSRARGSNPQNDCSPRLCAGFPESGSREHSIAPSLHQARYSFVSALAR